MEPHQSSTNQNGGADHSCGRNHILCGDVARKVALNGGCKRGAYTRADDGAANGGGPVGQAVERRWRSLSCMALRSVLPDAALARTWVSGMVFADEARIEG